MVFRDGWILVNKVPTHVLTWGCWVDETIPTEPLVLCVTGNPGITGFYKTFMETLYQELRFPVWILSHAGHEMPPKHTGLVTPKAREYPELYNTAGQVAHKEAFIKQYVPTDKSLYLIGHSLGAYIISELLKDEKCRAQVCKGYLLFPTLEQIADTPNGHFMTKLLMYSQPAIIGFSWVYSILPYPIQWHMVNMYFLISRRKCKEWNSYDPVIQLIHPVVLSSVFTLAKDEFENIKELDSMSLKVTGDKLKCFFGSDDGWCPRAHYDNLRRESPNVEATLLEDKFKHDFVLSTACDVAKIVAKEIQAEIDNKSSRRLDETM